MASEDKVVSVGTTEQGAEDARTPTLISPPESKTPPTATHKRNQADFAHDRSSEPVDASALTKALEHFERAGRMQERPMASPSRKRQRVYGDRLVGRQTSVCGRADDVADSFPIALDRTCRRAIHCFTTTLHPRHRRRAQSVPRTTNCIFSEVSIKH